MNDPTITNTSVTDNANRQLRIVRNWFKPAVLARLLSKPVSETIKTTIGNRNATTTFIATEGPLALPRC